MQTHMPTTVMKCPAKIIEEDAVNVSYQIRTMRNRPVFSYETLEKAKQGKVDAEKRVGIPMQIYRITLQEELID